MYTYTQGHASGGRCEPAPCRTPPELHAHRRPRSRPGHAGACLCLWMWVECHARRPIVQCVDGTHPSGAACSHPHSWTPPPTPKPTHQTPNTQLLIANFPEPEALAAAKPTLQAVLFPFAGIPPHKRTSWFGWTCVEWCWVPLYVHVHTCPATYVLCTSTHIYVCTCVYTYPSSTPSNIHTQSNSWKPSSPTAPSTTCTTTRPPRPRWPCPSCWRRQSAFYLLTGEYFF